MPHASDAWTQAEPRDRDRHCKERRSEERRQEPAPMQEQLHPQQAQDDLECKAMGHVSGGNVWKATCTAAAKEHAHYKASRKDDKQQWQAHEGS